ncbi:hypothetical protein ROZALSC1DRAFT_27162 [Rozella allomycis CSF55]|uniref:Uncharacterized protein n=1 Tax=Rozella allomycis (strain CSF55) TaxID=988480 RepID=A0A075AQY4_ROZAC|nr:hypothetical protein O9G_002719 [Rozella allomycis CSF55]RKP21426.1 hypothetical protein ROZALSC1DRAFT_27162 [Rozella allomycis CSF55]|eukprot:EPZ32633.1 hypothetical protein O9G_002719 [Rozella allomycis CSF55]
MQVAIFKLENFTAPHILKRKYAQIVAAIKIQRWFRHKVPLLRYRRALKEKTAAITIQRFWRKHNSAGLKIIRLSRRLNKGWAMLAAYRNSKGLSSMAKINQFSALRMELKKQLATAFCYLTSKYAGSLTCFLEYELENKSFAVHYNVRVKITIFREYEIRCYNDEYIYEKGNLKDLEHLNSVISFVTNPHIQLCRGVPLEYAPHTIQFSKDFIFQSTAFRSFRNIKCKGLTGSTSKDSLCDVCESSVKKHSENIPMPLINQLINPLAKKNSATPDNSMYFKSHSKLHDLALCSAMLPPLTPD